MEMEIWKWPETATGESFYEVVPRQEEAYVSKALLSGQSALLARSKCGDRYEDDFLGLKKTAEVDLMMM